MQRTFLSNLFLLILLNLVVKPLWVLGVEVEVQNVVGPDSYGDYFSLLNFAFMFSMILDFGLTNYNNRKISRTPELMGRVLVETALAKVLLSILFMGCLLIGATFLGYESRELGLLKYIGLMLFLQSFLLYARSNLSGIQWYKADVWVSVLDKTVMIVIVGLLLFTNVFKVEFNITYFILAQCAAYAISIVVVLILLFSKADQISFRFRLKAILGTLRESLPFALLAFLMLIYFRIDAVMIERILPDGDLQAGYYAQGYKLLEAAVMFAFLFSSLLLPMFSHMISKKQAVAELVQVSSKLLFFPSLVLVAIAVSYHSELMSLLYLEGAHESAQVLQILILVLLPLGASYIFGTLITAEGDLKLLNKISVVAIIVNTVANYFLIHSHGIIGAAIATLITQSLVSLVQWLICIKRHHLVYSKSSVLKCVGFLAALVALTLASKSLELDWKLKVLVVGVLSFLLLFGLRIFKISDVKQILMSRHSK